MPGFNDLWLCYRPVLIFQIINAQIISLQNIIFTYRAKPLKPPSGTWPAVWAMLLAWVFFVNFRFSLFKDKQVCGILQTLLAKEALEIKRRRQSRPLNLVICFDYSLGSTEALIFFLVLLSQSFLLNFYSQRYYLLLNQLQFFRRLQLLRHQVILSLFFF